MDYFEEAKKAFNVPKPLVFVEDPNHCSECEEVESKAQLSDVDSLTLEQAGDNWASLHNFLTNEGFLYYFPAFIRLCIETNHEDGFLQNFIFAITYEREKNRRLVACNSKQKKIVHDFLVWYKSSYPELVGIWLIQGDIEDAIQLWNV